MERERGRERRTGREGEIGGEKEREGVRERGKRERGREREGELINLCIFYQLEVNARPKKKTKKKKQNKAKHHKNYGYYPLSSLSLPLSSLSSLYLSLCLSLSSLSPSLPCSLLFPSKFLSFSFFSFSPMPLYFFSFSKPVCLSAIFARMSLCLPNYPHFSHDHFILIEPPGFLLIFYFGRTSLPPL